MSRGGPARSLVAEVVGFGRGAAIRPAFEPGPPIPLGRSSRSGAEIGDLVTATVRGRGARVTAVHGSSDAVPVVLRALLVHEGLERPFPRAVDDEVAELRDRGYLADPGRRDLRSQRVITIDPEGAKDHDDAIAVAPVEDGDAVRLWVHIADVGRFVPPGGAIDREAARRGNSVYVPGRVVPMLPARLSTDLCSLRPGVDRAVVTVEMVVATDGTIVEVRFGRSLIRSERRLSYPEVDALLSGGRLGDESLDADVRCAHRVAERLRARRMARGALEARSSEPTVVVDGDRVAAIDIEGQTRAHSLVGECMIAANEAVARHLIARGTPTIFRHHDDPAQGRIVHLLDQLDELGVAVPALPEGDVGPSQRRMMAATAATAVGRHLAASGGGEGAGLWGLVLRSLRQAHYSPHLPTHSGLASAAYLHFTSPIRRYPDLLAHRALLDGLGVGDPAPGAAELAEAADHCSATEREASVVERTADAICAAFYLREVLGRRGVEATFEGEITGVIDAGVFVTFERVITGLLPARALPEDHYRPDPLAVMLVGERRGRRLRIGDQVRVRVERIERLRGRVALVPAEGGGRPVGGRARRRLAR